MVSIRYLTKQTHVQFYRPKVWTLGLTPRNLSCFEFKFDDTVKLGNKERFDKEQIGTVKLGNKERFDKEQIGIKEPFSVTNLPFTS